MMIQRNALPLRELLSLTAFLALAGAFPGAAQDETRHGIFIESLDVNVVNIEVVVSDKDGNPILGLTADDFELLEDGKPIEVSNFYAVENARRKTLFDQPLAPEDTAGAEPLPAENEPDATEGGLTASEKSFLSKLAKKFEVVADPDGIRLLPRWIDPGFEVVEVDRGQISLDWTPVDEATLKLRIGKEAEGIVRLAELDDEKVVAFFNLPEGRGSIAALPDNQRLFLVVFIDNQNISPNRRNRVLEELRVELRRAVRPGDRVMVASFNRRVSIEQPFTNNLSRVMWALSRIEKAGGQTPLQADRRRILARMTSEATPTSAGGGPFAAQVDSAETDADIADRILADIRVYAKRAELDVRVTFEGLETFVDSLAGLPGRKAVLYVSEGLESRPGEGLFQAWADRYGSNAATAQVALSVEAEARRYDASDEMRRVAAHAAANRVTFYSLDAAGSQRAMGVTSEFAGSPAELSLGSRFNEQESLLYLAAATGGRALLGAPRARKLLERIAADFSNYYSLGYESPKGGDGKYHRVKVRVKREGVKVRHVEGYQDKTAEQRMSDRTLSALILDVAENPLNIRVQLGDQNEEKKGRWLLPILVKIPISKLALIPQDRSHHGKVSVYLAVQDKEGRLSPPQRIDVPVNIPNEELLIAMSRDIGYGFNIQVRPGVSKMAIGVRDELAATDSTVNLSVSVGDG